MRRRLLDLLTALSPLLCVAVCALWVRSYRVTDDLQYNTLETSTTVTSSVGALSLHVVEWGVYLREHRPPGLHYQRLNLSSVYIGRPSGGLGASRTGWSCSVPNSSSALGRRSATPAPISGSRCRIG